MTATVRCDNCNNACGKDVANDETHPWLVVLELQRGRSVLQGCRALHLCDSCGEFAWRFLCGEWAATAVREGAEAEP